MMKKTNGAILPLQVNDQILQVIDQDRYDSEHSEDLSCLLRKILFFKKTRSSNKSAIAAVKNEVIGQLSRRNREEVYSLWQELGIDGQTISAFMKTFAVEDAAGAIYDKIIPADCALIFVWFRYGIYPWEGLGGEFGIYTYVWLYGFFFPDEIFAIPSPQSETDKQRQFFDHNYDLFCRQMTMELVIKLILLYQDEKKAKSAFFEPDLTWKNSKINCNPDWKNKLQATLNQHALNQKENTSCKVLETTEPNHIVRHGGITH